MNGPSPSLPSPLLDRRDDSRASRLDRREAPPLLSSSADSAGALCMACNGQNTLRVCKSSQVGRHRRGARVLVLIAPRLLHAHARTVIVGVDGGPGPGLLHHGAHDGRACVHAWRRRRQWRRPRERGTCGQSKNSSLVGHTSDVATSRPHSASGIVVVVGGHQAAAAWIDGAVGPPSKAVEALPTARDETVSRFGPCTDRGGLDAARNRVRPRRATLAAQTPGRP